MKTVTWYLDRLPGLYDAFVRTYEVRYSDEIHRLVEAMVSYLGDAALKQTVLDHLLDMHERLGFPSLNFAGPKHKAG